MSSIRLYEGEFNQRIHAYTSNGKSKSLSRSTRVYFKIKIASTLWRKGISEKLDLILLLQQKSLKRWRMAYTNFLLLIEKFLS